jgi:hypothetical protein
LVAKRSFLGGYAEILGDAAVYRCDENVTSNFGFSRCGDAGERREFPTDSDN